MRDSLLVISVAILLYLAFASIFSDPALIGSYGAIFAKFNYKAFGYLAYANMIILIFPVYSFYKKSGANLRRFEIVLSSILFFLTLLILQALIVENPVNSGFIGNSVASSLAPFVGIAGVWMFWAMVTILSVVIIFDINFDEIISSLKIQEFKKVIEPSREPSAQPNESAAPQSGRRVFSYKSDPFKEKELSEQIDKSEDKKSTSKPTEPFEIDVVKSTKAKKSATEVKHHAVIVNELEENKQLQEQLEKGKQDKPRDFKLPQVSFLAKAKNVSHDINESVIDAKIEDLIEKLKQFKIDGDVIRTYTGPVVTTFEFKPAAHVKVSKILNLQDDLAMALKAQTIRIQAPIPGKNVVGIEIPNEHVETIYLRDIVEDKLFNEAKSSLTIALGKDIVGKPFLTDLKKLPHLLIAGTTGSGKSVGINAIILSLLYRNSPDQLRMLMIDPKMLEFSIYNDIPHLLTPVITKPKQAIAALNNMVGEMERRYAMLSESRTKNIDGYNEKAKKTGTAIMPYIVVVIDELADLMMTSGKDVEYSIARLAQMARASGIHLIVATQRPSVDVVTGLIKANLPSRISFKVGQKIDSKVILDSLGAESLLGRGDMLFTPPGMSGLVRLHAPWSSEEEIEKIVEHLKKQREVSYDRRFLEESSGSGSSSNGEVSGDIDELYEEAKEIVLSEKKTSISYLQRRLQIGYNRSARIIEQLEQRGVLSEANSKGNREILT